MPIGVAWLGTPSRGVVGGLGLYQQGLMRTLANQPRTPDHVRQEASRWGMCKDEFAEGGDWQAKVVGSSAATAAAQAFDD